MVKVYVSSVIVSCWINTACSTATEHCGGDAAVYMFVSLWTNPLMWFEICCRSSDLFCLLSLFCVCSLTICKICFVGYIYWYSKLMLYILFLQKLWNVQPLEYVYFKFVQSIIGRSWYSVLQKISSLYKPNLCSVYMDANNIHHID